MTAIEILDRTGIGDYTRRLDDEGTVPELSPLDHEEFLRLLREGQYIELYSMRVIQPVRFEDLSIRSLVNTLTNSNPARLQALRDREAVAGPYLGYDESRGRVQRQGITIYARNQETMDGPPETI